MDIPTVRTEVPDKGCSEGETVRFLRGTTYEGTKLNSEIWSLEGATVIGMEQSRA